MAEAEPASTTASQSMPQRDAVVFLPAISIEWSDQTIETMSRRFAVALERSAAPSAKFVAKLSSHSEAYGDGGKLKASVATISRVDGADELALFDLYGFDYHRPLTGAYADRNLFLKAGLLVAMIFESTFRLIRSVTRRNSRAGGGHATRPREVFQVLFGVLVLFLFCAYAAIVIWALIQTFTQIHAFQSGHPGASIAQAVVVVSAAIGLSLPKVRESISNAAVDYLSATTYLSYGARRPLISGQLEALLEHLAEHQAPTYA